MSAKGYAVEITNLSPNATEKDVHEFFALCGAIQHVEIIRAGECACTAYVTFRNHHAVETAVLLSGETILDRPICVTQFGDYEDYNPRGHSSWKIEDESRPSYAQGHKVIPSAGAAVYLAQDMVKTVAAKGYVLGKDALGKAKSFDETHQVSATAVAKLSEAARSVDQRYHISGTTKSAVSTTRSTATSAANAVVNTSYFSKGALWLSGALSRASQVAGDLGSRGVSK